MNDLPSPGTAVLPVGDRDEQRGGVRYLLPLGLSCRVVVRPEFRCRSAQIHDISAQGVGLVLPERLAEGTVLALQLAGGRPGLSRVVGARVAHARPLEGGQWLMGCALTWPFSEDEVFAVLQGNHPCGRAS
jgi:hypothetical protein